jgi:RNase H-like domain found in reverse transcriptase/Integrase zinc binding domain
VDTCKNRWKILDFIPVSTMNTFTISNKNPKLVWLRPTSSDEELQESDYEIVNTSDSDKDYKVSYKYKKVDQKVHPVSIQTPEHQKPLRQFPKDPLLNLPLLPYNPPSFTPTAKITAERMDELAIDKHKELLPEEKKLLQHIIQINERSIAFDENERGTFRRDYFSDYIIPTIEHEPWIEKNIPLPQGYKDELIRLLKEKIKAGVYERATTAYRSKWFYVKKKDGGLRIVHDLQKLNSVTIRDSAVPPIIEEFVEAYAGRSVYTVLDMYWGFHARMLDIHSRDLTAFQTPLGSFRLTSLPMGYANAPAEFQACMMYILQDEVPEVAGVFIDDIPIKGPPTRYVGPDGKEETLPQNSGIRRYIWEHLNDVHRILHRIGEAGGTVSAKKMQLCRAEVEIVGHQCSAKGREPVDIRVKRILDWPAPKNLKEVRGFLGLCGTVRIWIKDYSQIARPLVDLTRKAIEFHWGPEQDQAFNGLKALVTKAPALRPIDYTSDQPVILSVDTSIYGVGFILSQEDEQGRRAPARYGSLPLKPNELKYGQSKLELYGLFRALKRFRPHLIGAKKLIVEVDASSIKGMLKNADTLGTPLDRWVAGILQFDFKLVHVPAHRHRGPDALSRRRYATDEEETPESDPEEWVDHAALTVQVQPESQIQEAPPPLQSNDKSSPRTFLAKPSFPYISDDTFQDPLLKMSNVAEVAPRYTEQDLIDILTYLVKDTTPMLKTRREQEQFQKKAEPFRLKGNHMYRLRPGKTSQVVIFTQKRRQEILWEMHESAGHHGVWAVQQQIVLRYFWPGMKDQIKKHIQSCHTCQLRSTKKMHLPVTISHPPCLFSKVYLDVMKMPPARGKEWLIGCRDDLSGVTETKAIKHDRAKVIAKFFLKRIILRYGIVQEVVTDNGPSFAKEFTRLLNQYGIRHIKISPYNSQANGVVERGHFNIREALVKLCEGDLSKWPLMVPAATYADRITVRRATGFSPYYLLHGVHPFMPGDLTDVTFHIADYRPGMSSQELIMARTRQLLRLPEDTAKARKILGKSRSRFKKAYEQKYAQRLQKEPYKPESLVLIRNKEIENSVSIERKTADRYMGPYRVIRQTQGGSYILAEMDGVFLKHHVAAFRLLPYERRSDLEFSMEDQNQHSGNNSEGLEEVSGLSESDGHLSNGG